MPIRSDFELDLSGALEQVASLQAAIATGLDAAAGSFSSSLTAALDRVQSQVIDIPITADLTQITDAVHSLGDLGGITVPVDATTEAVVAALDAARADAGGAPVNVPVAADTSEFTNAVDAARADAGQPLNIPISADVASATTDLGALSSSLDSIASVTATGTINIPVGADTSEFVAQIDAARADVGQTAVDVPVDGDTAPITATLAGLADSTPVVVPVDAGTESLITQVEAARSEVQADPVEIAVDGNVDALAATVGAARDEIGGQPLVIPVDGDTGPLTAAVTDAVATIEGQPLDLPLGTNLDVTGLNAAVDAAVQDVAAQPIEVPVDGNTDSLITAVEAARDEETATPVVVPVSANTDEFAAAVDAARAAIDTQPIDIPVDANTDVFTSTIDAAVADAEQQTVDVPIDGDATELVSAVDAARADAETPIDVPVDGDTAQFTSALDAARADAEAPVDVPLSADASELLNVVDSARTDAAATPIDIPVTADTTQLASEIDSAVQGLDVPPVDVTATVDTSTADQSLADLTDAFDTTGAAATGAGTKFGGFGAGLELVTSGTEAFQGVAEAATGKVQGLASSAGLFGGEAAGVAAAAVAVAAGFKEFFTAGEEVVAAQERLNLVFGRSAEAVKQIDLGGLVGNLDDLATKAGSSGPALEQITAKAGQFAEGAGLSTSAAEKYAQGLDAIALRAVALNPQLGDAANVAQRLELLLGTGGRRLVEYGISLSTAEIHARALAIAHEKGETAVTQFDRSLAGEQLALESIGNKLGPDFQRGIQQTSVQLKSVGEEIRTVLGTAGAPLAAPTLELLKGLAPVVEGLAKAIGPLLTDVLDVVGPPLVAAFQPLAEVLTGLGRILGDLAPAFRLVGDAIAVFVTINPVTLLLRGLGVALNLVADALQPVGDLLSAVEEAFRGLIQTVQAGAGPAFQHLLDFLAPVGDAIASIGAAIGSFLPSLSDIGAAISAAFGHVLSDLAPVGEAIAGLVATLGTAITSGIGDVVAHVGDVFGPVVTIIEDVFGGAFAAISALFQTDVAIWQQVGADISAVFGGIHDAAVTALNELTPIVDVAAAGIEAVINAVNAAVSEIASLVGPAFAQVADAASHIVDVLRVVGESVGAVFVAVGIAVVQVVDAVRSVATEFGTVLGPAISALEPIVGRLGTAFRDIGLVLGAVAFAAPVEVLVSVFKTAELGVLAFRETLNLTIGPAITFFTSIVDAVREDIGVMVSLAGAVKDVGVALGGLALDVAVAAFNSMRETADLAVATLETLGRAFGGLEITVIVDAFHEFVQTAQGAVSAVTTVVGGLANLKDALGAVLISLGPVGVGIIAIGAALQKLRSVDAPGGISGLEAFKNSALSILGPAGLVVSGLSTLAEHLNGSGSKAKDTGQKLSDMGSVLFGSVTNVKALGTAVDGLDSTLSGFVSTDISQGTDKIKKGFQEAGVSVGEVTAAIEKGPAAANALADSIARINPKDGSLQAAAQHVRDLETEMEKSVTTQLQTGVATGQLTKQQEDQIIATAHLGTAHADLRLALQLLTEAENQTNTAADANKTAIAAQSGAFSELAREVGSGATTIDNVGAAAARLDIPVSAATTFVKELSKQIDSFVSGAVAKLPTAATAISAFAQGVTTARSQADTLVNKASSGLQSAEDQVQKAYEALAKAHEKGGKQGASAIKTAEDQLKTADKNLADAQNTAKDDVIKAADGITKAIDPKNFIKILQDQIQSIAEFQTNLDILFSKGLGKLAGTLASQGPVVAGGLAKTFAHDLPDAITADASIHKLDTTISSISTDLKGHGLQALQGSIVDLGNGVKITINSDQGLGGIAPAIKLQMEAAQQELDKGVGNISKKALTPLQRANLADAAGAGSTFSLTPAGAQDPVAAAADLGNRAQSAFTNAYTPATTAATATAAVAPVITAQGPAVKNAAATLAASTAGAVGDQFRLSFPRTIPPAFETLIVVIAGQLGRVKLAAAGVAASSAGAFGDQLALSFPRSIPPAFGTVATVIGGQKAVVENAIKELAASSAGRFGDQLIASFPRTIPPAFGVAAGVIGGQLNVVRLAAAQVAASTAGGFGDQLALSFPRTIPPAWAVVPGIISAQLGPVKFAAQQVAASTAGAFGDQLAASFGRSIPPAFNGLVGLVYNEGFAIGVSVDDGLANGIDAHASGPLNAALNIANSIHTIISTALGTNSPSTVMIKEGQDVVRGMTVGLSDSAVLADTERAASMLAGRVTGGVSGSFSTAGLATTGQTIGQAVVDGLTGALRTDTSTADAATTLAGQVETSMKSRLEITSPSQVAFGIGQNVAQGLAQGITAGTGTVTTSTQGLVNSATLSLNSGFNDPLIVQAAKQRLADLQAADAAAAKAGTDAASIAAAAAAKAAAALQQFQTFVSGAVSALFSAANAVSSFGGAMNNALLNFQTAQAAMAAQSHATGLLDAAWRQANINLFILAASGHASAQQIAADNAAVVKAHTALINSWQSLTQAIQTFQNAQTALTASQQDPAKFVADLQKQNADAVVFQKDLQTLVAEGNGQLAAELAKAGPATAKLLADALAASPAKAAAAEAALEQAKTFTTTFQDYLQKNFPDVFGTAGAQAGQTVKAALFGALNASGTPASSSTAAFTATTAPTIALPVNVTPVPAGVGPIASTGPVLVGPAQSSTTPVQIQLDLTVQLQDGTTVTATPTTITAQPNSKLPQRVQAVVSAI